MKKNVKFLVMLLLSLACFNACDKDIPEPEQTVTNTIESEDAVMVNSGVLFFDSPEALYNQVELIRETENYYLNLHPRTKSGSVKFVSLRQSLIDKGLQAFTDAELSEIIAEELIYEPEDSIIIDPYFCGVLNDKREVQVGEKIFKSNRGFCE